MPDHSITATAQTGPVPADGPIRTLSVVDPGDTHTMLLSGAQTAGRYCLIDSVLSHRLLPGPACARDAPPPVIAVGNAVKQSLHDRHLRSSL